MSEKNFNLHMVPRTEEEKDIVMNKLYVQVKWAKTIGLHNREGCKKFVPKVEESF